MTAIVFKKFAGWIPYSPAELLPNDAAQESINCDFSKGILAPLKAFEAYRSLSSASSPVKGLFTEDGATFYTWTTHVQGYQSPVNNEVHGRMYYAYGGMFNASFLPSRMSGFEYGGTPTTGNRWRVGVPWPNLHGPALTLGDRDQLADYPAAVVTVNAWWEVDGVAQNRQDNLSVNILIPWKEFTFTAPAAPTDTESPPQLVAEVIVKEGSQTLFTVNTRTNNSEPAKTLALPGGVEVTLSLVSGSTYKLTFMWGVIETRAYVYTHVNTWGEESSPSPPTLISPTYMQDVFLVCERADFDTDNFRPWAGTNIYRTFGSSANYLRVDAEFSSSTHPNAWFDNYIDRTRAATEISTSLPSLDWYTAPEMDYVVLANNGWFASFKSNANTLNMSEPYRPHAWPYSVTFNKGILGVAVSPQALVVTTTDGCYLVTGPHPKSVVVNKLPIPVGGISHKSICQVEGGVAFLSNDGIVFVEGSSASLAASQALWTREKWRELYENYLADMWLGYHDGFLIATSPSGVGFTVRLDEASGSLTSFPHATNALFRLPVLDTLYATNGTMLYRFRTGSDLSLTWRSKDFIFPKYTPLGALFARTTGSLTLTIYADGNLYWSTALPANGYLRIPATNNNLSCSQRRWSFKLTGVGECHELALGQTMAELQRV